MANEKKHEMDKKNFNRMNATLREYLDTIKDISIKAQINDIYKKIQKQLDPATLVEVESTDNTLTYFCTSGLKKVLVCIGVREVVIYPVKWVKKQMLQSMHLQQGRVLEICL